MKKSRLLGAVCIFTYIIKKVPKLAASGLLMLSIPMVSNASIVYDNFGPGDDFNSQAGWTIDSSLVQGAQFTAAVSGLFTSLDVGMGVIIPFSLPPQAVQFDLYTDAGDSLGTLLESLTVNVTGGFLLLATYTGLANGSTSFVAGQKYWLIAQSSGDVGWNLNSTGDTGLRWINGSTSLDTLAAFRVNAVPIPAALWLFGSGLLGLIGMARRKKTT